MPPDSGMNFIVVLRLSPTHESSLPERPVLGTLAYYFSEPREPNPRDLDVAAVLTHAAAFIISRHRETEMRRLAKAALRESEWELRSADQRKDEFLALLAHELRNPLAPIRNTLHVLKATAAGDAEVYAALRSRRRSRARRAPAANRVAAAAKCDVAGSGTASDGGGVSERCHSRKSPASTRPSLLPSARRYSPVWPAAACHAARSAASVTPVWS
jgi:signal transduction histidine kinase